MENLEHSFKCCRVSRSTPRQKKPVSRTVGPRSRPGTHCPPLKKQVGNASGRFTTWTYSPFTKKEIGRQLHSF
ncbi:hypothetical protein J6590_036489 [Homalodisca vitripennis]|nr:hypothetical protein J6590_036489 [Homalodisca vitripennis]